MANKKQAKKPPPKKRGPEPERLKLQGEWETLIGEALHKQRPPEGWPKPAAMPQRARKAKKK